MSWEKVKVLWQKHILLDRRWKSECIVFMLENDLEERENIVKIKWKTVKVLWQKHIWWEMSWKNDQWPLFTTHAAKTFGKNRFGN